MSADPTAAPPRAPRSVTRPQLTWLESELRTWEADGILDGDQAGRILSRYRADARFPLARLLLTIGAVFIGIGVIWLVAANIDALTPMTRFVGISLFWLATLVGAEVLAGRRADDRSSPLVGAVRLIAALAFGAVIFQAAQSLQVPAYEPALVGWWSLGSLVHAYAVRAVLPLVVAILTGAAWFCWHVLPGSDSGTTVVLCLVSVAVLGVAVAAAHERWAPELADPWRELGAAFLLVGLFIAALPFVDGGVDWSPTLAGGLAVVATAAVLAMLITSGETRWEVAGAAAAALAGTALVAWQTGTDLGFDSTSDTVSATDVLHSTVSVAVYVVVAVGVAVVGALRESWRLTALATVGLVVFTTFQSFSVFSRILEGAWLFLALGLVFLGTGYLFDRARRRLVAVVTDDDQPESLTDGDVR